jgi:hypothetical protein
MNPTNSRSGRRNLPTRSGALAAVLAAAAIGAACSDGAAAASLTRDEWIEQADAVCLASEARFAEAYDAVGEDPTPAEIEVLFDAVIVEVGHQLDGIADLTPPEAIRADVDAFLVEARGALEEAGSLDPQEAYTHEVSPFDPALAMLNELDVTGCGVAERSVEITYPLEGAVVTSPVAITMQAHGFTVEPAGEVRPDAGHLHVMVDVPCVEPGQVVPRDESHLHFGDGQTGTSIDLEPGEHTLCLQAADGAHVALDLTSEHTIEVAR